MVCSLKVPVAIPLMDILDMTSELVLTSKAVFAAILAADDMAWIFGTIHAMFGSIMALEIGKFLRCSRAVFLGASEYTSLDEMLSLVAQKVA